MNIIIDIRVFLEYNWSGISWYTYYLIDNLLKIDDKNQYILFYNRFKINKQSLLNCYIVKLLNCFLKSRANYQLTNALSKLSKYPNVKIVAFHYPNKIFNFLMRFFKFPKIDRLVQKTVNKKNNNTIFFAPNINFIALSKDIKFVLTIHDLSFIRFPEFFSRKMRLWHRLINPKKLCIRANQIISISENTKSDLIETYGIKPDKIRVLYPGVDNNKFKIIQEQEKLKQIKKKYSLSDKFILAVGTLEPRKNIESVIKTFELLLENKNNHLGSSIAGENIYFWSQDKKDLNLVIVGGYGWKYKNILKLLKRSKFCDKIRLIKAGHKDLPYIYNLAQVFLYLSFYEGFGLPPLEAMACGLPTVVSFAPAMPEILGDSVILVDPYNLSEIVLALKQVLIDNNLRQQLIKKGLEKVKQFNWEKTAEMILQQSISFKL